MAEKLITKSFERLLSKGKHRGFITYEELGKSLGKRNSTNENIERAFIILVDEKITLVEKKSQYQSNKKKETATQAEEKTSDKSDVSRYQKDFEKYFLKSLTSRLSDYSSSRFEVINSDQKSANYTIINSKILPKDGNPEIKIDWRIYTKNPDKPLIRDLIIEGLSLARTQKEEFNSIIQGADGDVEALFASLRNFSKK